MLVPVGFLEHSENEPPLAFGERGGGRICRDSSEELGQVPSLDYRILGKNNRVAYGVFQLTDIAGPVVIHKELHSAGRKRVDRLPFFDSVLAEKVFR